MTDTKISFEQKDESFAEHTGARRFYRPRANAMSRLPYFDGTQSYELDYNSDGQIYIVDGLDEDARIRDLQKRFKCSLSRIECVFDEVTIKNTAHMLTRAEELIKEMKQYHDEYQNIVED